MPLFDREIIEQVVAACQAGLGEASLSYRRTFDGPAKLTLGDSGAFSVEQLPTEYHGAGLILILRVGNDAALVVLPASGGLIPEWCITPDATGKSKLDTLAVELGTILLPEEFAATGGTARYVPDLDAALHRAELSSKASRVAIHIQSGTQSATMSLIWPATQAAAALEEPGTAGNETGKAPAAGDWADPVAHTPADDVSPFENQAAASPLGAGPAHRRKIQYEELEDGLAQLPSYSRSLLKIRVPIMVTLAEARQPVANVLDIGPGSIIHFNKPCEDTLALEIAGQKIALGEAVKVGDKFGLWITSMILPAERFWVIGNRASMERAK